MEQVSFYIYFGVEHLSFGKWGNRFKNNIYIYIISFSLGKSEWTLVF